MTRIPALALAALLVALPACSDDEPDSSATPTPTTATISLGVTSPPQNANVLGNVLDIQLAVSGLAIVKADGDTSGKTGHLHLFLDRDPVAAGQPIPKEPGIVHFAADKVRLTGLSIGQHVAYVVAGDGTHTRIGDAMATYRWTSAGPTIKATAPASVKAGSAVSVAVTAQGVRIVKADGSAGIEAGAHYHVFVDRDPIPPGQVVPKDAAIHSATSPIEVPGLTAGEHTIWVVLGDGQHRITVPWVAHQLTVTVTP